ncbi:hypothetical protein A9Q84_01845 [Halobacteriovorax marinus]|uniref:Uncharacterized protein n=1 Tax=Halobacteriovorax marinus TaxID=97084 RepID=A0A1Y5FHW4_9BACT|nr:hypothetical protein A9Q84_01845 [Halobacteriovorax marinus]
MKSFKKTFAVLICYSLLSNSVFANGQEWTKLTDVQTELIEKCMEASDCNLDEMNSYVKSIGVAGENAVLLKSIETKKGTLGNIIETVKDAGVAVIGVTIVAGATVVNVAADSLEYITDLPPVRAALNGGKKVITFTVKGIYNGVERTIVFTLKATRAVLTFKPVKIAIQTSFKVIGNIAEGTYKIIKAVVTSRPVVLILNGVEAVLTLKIVKKIFSATGKVIGFAVETTFDVARVVVKGAWTGVKYAWNGALVVIGAPYLVLRSIWRAIRG